MAKYGVSQRDTQRQGEGATGKQMQHGEPEQQQQGQTAKGARLEERDGGGMEKGEE